MILRPIYMHAIAGGLIRAQYATEARKACTEPGVSVAFLNVYTDISSLAVARLLVTKPDAWAKEVLVDQADIHHIRDNVTLDSASDAALEEAKVHLVAHTQKIIEDQRRDFDESLLGRAIAWISGPK